MDETFEIIDQTEIDECQTASEKLMRTFELQNQEIIDDAVKELGDYELSEKDVNEIAAELRHLEERLHLWREVRRRTIERLREIADYMNHLDRKTGIVKLVGSGGGALAGGLTIAGGVMTVLSAGAAMPIMLAGAGLGLASGVTGGAAAITNKVLSSQQMTEVETAMEVDSAATCELEQEVDKIRNDTRLSATSVMMTVGGLASSTKSVVDVVKGAAPGQTILAGLEVVGSVLGEDVNKQIAKLLLHTSGRVISGTVTSMFGGVTLLWDVYQLKKGVRELAAGGQEGEMEIRSIADQLEDSLNKFNKEGGED